MLQNTSLVLLTICINYISSEYTIYSDGWIPVASDRVYNQIRREWERNFIYTTVKPTTEDRNLVKLKETKLNAANEMKLKQNRHTLDHTKNDDDDNIILQSKIDINGDTQTTLSSGTESPRKAKKITDDLSVENNIDIDDVYTKEQHSNLEENRETETLDRSNTYEVAEDTELDNPENQNGYDYTPPTTNKQNLSSTLVNILSKYNIKHDDRLQNYDLSRQIKGANRLPHIHTAWNPFRYNNQNHLSVDPLLAVFLSNYGFYLPSLYGIKSNYNNLYGYLASNNIHNNRPFGLYKIFSDTDSWN